MKYHKEIISDLFLVAEVTDCHVCVSHPVASLSSTESEPDW